MSERLTPEEIVKGYELAFDRLDRMPFSAYGVVDDKLGRVSRYIKNRMLEELALVLEDEPASVLGDAEPAPDRIIYRAEFAAAPAQKTRFWDTALGEWVRALGGTAVIVGSIFAGFAVYYSRQGAQIVTYDKRDGSITINYDALRSAIGCPDDSDLRWTARTTADTSATRSTPYCVSSEYGDGDVQ